MSIALDGFIPWALDFGGLRLWLPYAASEYSDRFTRTEYEVTTLFPFCKVGKCKRWLLEDVSDDVIILHAKGIILMASARVQELRVQRLFFDYIYRSGSCVINNLITLLYCTKPWYYRSIYFSHQNGVFKRADRVYCSTSSLQIYCPLISLADWGLYGHRWIHRRFFGWARCQSCSSVSK